MVRYGGLKKMQFIGTKSEELVREELEVLWPIVEKTMLYEPHLDRSRVQYGTFSKVLKNHPLKRGLMKLARRFPEGWPDFICRDGNYLLFVETKSQDSHTTIWQDGIAKKLLKMGVEVELRQVTHLEILYHEQTSLNEYGV